jgi:hypothetical protein
MAVPSYSASGSITVNVSLNANYAVQTSSVPPIQTAYNQGISASPKADIIFTPGSPGNTTPGALARIYLASGNVATTATTSTAVLNLNTGSDIAGNTSALQHVREIMVFNDGLVGGYGTGSINTDSSVLIWDTSFTSSFGPGASKTAPMQTGTKIEIPCGSMQRFSKFVDVGWTCTSGTAVVALAAAAGNVSPLSYRVIVCGD